MGMGITLLKRRRTALSIPLGLRQFDGTHLKRSDWWRQKRLVPVIVRCWLSESSGRRARRTLLHDGDVLLCEDHLD